VKSGEWINLLSTLHVNSEELLHHSLGWTSTGPVQNGWIGSGLVQKREEISLGRHWPNTFLAWCGPTSLGRPYPNPNSYRQSSTQFLLGWMSTQPGWAQPIYLGQPITL
jgi:hypothetical protein